MEKQEVKRKVCRRCSPKNIALKYIRERCDRPWIEEAFISDDKGRGVVACEDIIVGQFIAEYTGQIISRSEAEKREAVDQGSII